MTTLREAIRQFIIHITCEGYDYNEKYPGAKAFDSLTFYRAMLAAAPKPGGEE